MPNDLRAARAQEPVVRSARPASPVHLPERPRFINDLDVLRARRTLKWQLGPDTPDRICLGVAEMDLYPPEFLRSALVEALGLGETGYGLPEAQEAACGRYLSAHHDAGVAGLRCTTDVLTGLRTLMRSGLAPGSPVIVETPVYGDLFTVVREAGLEPVAVPLLRTGAQWQHDWAALATAAREGARGWIVCQPHNPVGRAWTLPEMSQAIAVCREHDLLLLANEVHIPLGMPGRAMPSAFADTAIHGVRAFGLTSASKAFNVPGLKSATVYGSERSAAALADLPQSLLGRPGSLGAVATVACYGPEGVAWLRTLREELAERIRLVLDELASLPVRVSATAPEATYLVWAEADGERDARRFAEALDTSGIHVLAGESFGGTAFDRCFRLNAASHPAVLRTAFARLRAALR
ncbi:aminotransferase class I/II-fold pyridoxal phosphate-dependent enzyme [Streptomyces sioyaensis]|uniref:cysteine-S-conjugate beta-lyase n=1 Tax=Streptomyces sioyaensis TaxID=67364 RepID=A0A4Q1R7Q4_9ACTN|nr:aminotransferase class I/II-fold pyridoxal phosphate-dependent enzyme [Streptomyces sioyaensis]RXS69373.1 aminotransferase class I/II-fold pyridoxal phosphate-dependent enzyme [Streptomyces sioyaensis]